MVSQADILTKWRDSKSRSSFYQLQTATEVAAEFKGKQWGHPSNYAAVRIAALPSAELTIDSSATYPPSVSPEYAVRLLEAIRKVAEHP